MATTIPNPTSVYVETKKFVAANLKQLCVELRERNQRGIIRHDGKLHEAIGMMARVSDWPARCVKEIVAELCIDQVIGENHEQA